MGGRLQADYSQFDGFYTVNGDSADAAYFRRAFIEIGGVAFTDWKYQFNYDLSHNAGSSEDGYWDEASIQYSGFNPINIKVGRFDPDFGLEKATSSVGDRPERNAADLVDWTNGHQNGLGIQVNGTAGPSLYGSLGLHARTRTTSTATASSSSTCVASSPRCMKPATSCTWRELCPA